MISFFKKHSLLLLFIGMIFIFFLRFLLKGLLPVPADTIVGMYHPFRDYLAQKYPRGYPFKNFLITDPVRQQYPWKKLVIESWKKGEIPWWNPYSFAGTPLLANFQSGAFYPFNLLFLFFSFNTAWSIYILLQPVLALIFTYFLLKNYRLSDWAAVLGGLCFAFGGFMTAWFEWGNIGHTALWLPLMLLAIDRIISQKSFVWQFVFLFSLLASFFAGHLQTAFYVIFFSFIYLLVKLFSIKTKQARLKLVLLFIIHYLLFIILSFVQWWPTLKFINLSARLTDIPQILFLPWQNLIQLVVPDFFGNPSTMNYWGEWNYGEYVAYIGIISFFLAFYFLWKSRLSDGLFFKINFLFSLLLATKNPISQIPFILKLPLFSSSSPSRILVISCFSLSVLAAFGFDRFLKFKKLKPAFYFLLFLAGLWSFVLLAPKFLDYNWVANLSISKRNLILPTALFLAFFAISWLLFRLKKFPFILYTLYFILILFDLLRFFNKFNTWSPKEFLFPQTKIIEFLQKQKRPFRILALDDRILPPNFSSAYHLETVQGYDPLFLNQYGKLVHFYETGRKDKGYSFNRQINPKNINNDLINLLNVKYLLSFDDLPKGRFEKIIEEGKTKLYENKKALPRVYFKDCDGKIEILEYSEQKMKLKVDSPDKCWLVFSQNYYPGWKIKINGRKVKVSFFEEIFPAVLMSKEKSIVDFYYRPY